MFTGNELSKIGFLTLIQVLDGPERDSAFSFFEIIPQSQANGNGRAITAAVQ